MTYAHTKIGGKLKSMYNIDRTRIEHMFGEKVAQTSFQNRNMRSSKHGGF